MNHSIFHRMKLKQSVLQWRSFSSHEKLVLCSNLFRTSEPTPKKFSPTPTLCKSLTLMLKQGLMSLSSGGLYNLMPLAIRSLEKLCYLIDKSMMTVDGQKIILPSLTVSGLWKTSGRWDNINIDLFKLKDRHSVDYCLGPTFEENITSIVASSCLSYRKFPLRLYQISPKFRDEMSPKLGLLRSREFIMKDMYSFDLNQESAVTTYKKVCSAYSNFFDTLGVDYFQVKGSPGDMGGSHSHEFHFPSPVGQDEILVCPKCRNGVNMEALSEFERKAQSCENIKLEDSYSLCDECGAELEKKTGIEVGHAFLLGTTYSKPFSANYISQNRTAELLEMGCYGLGITRILASSVECLSTDEKIRWPHLISPYLVAVIPPKKGSRESMVHDFSVSLAHSLCEIEYLRGNVLFDDRLNFTIGWRVQDADTLGIPFVLITGKRSLEDVPRIELLDTYKNQTHFMTHAEIMSFFRELSTKTLQEMKL